MGQIRRGIWRAVVGCAFGVLCAPVAMAGVSTVSTHTFGSGGLEHASSMARDAQGNLYVAGDFSSTVVDFDPGPAVVSRSSAGNEDNFVMKLDAGGNLVWLSTFASSSSAGTGRVLVDASGNVYVCGLVAGTGDWDPGPGVVTFTSNGSYDIVVWKLDTAGNLLWMRSAGGTLDDYGVDMVLDSSGNVIVSGYFQNSVDFDPGAGSAVRTSAGSFDGILWKLSPAGNFISASQLSGTGDEIINNITIDAADHIYTTGYISSAADFDFGAGTSILTPTAGRDMHVAKYNSTGALQWARLVSGTGDQFASGIRHGNTGNIYVGGYSNGNADFDPGAGTFTLTNAGDFDATMLTLDANGNFINAWQLASAAYERFDRISVDDQGNLYAAGSFTGTLDFDPGAGIVQRTSNGSGDAFFMRVDANGAFRWATTYGSGNYDVGTNIQVAPGKVYCSGYFAGATDFDIGTGTDTRNTNGAQDAYITTLKEGPAGVDGDFGWVRQIGGAPDGPSVSKVVTDAAGNIHVVGHLNGTIDFDPGSGTFTLANTPGRLSPYVYKLSPSGALIWAKAFTDPTDSRGYDIALDSFGNVYITGFFGGTMDCDPGPGTFNMTSASASDAYVIKLDAAGNFAWAKRWGTSVNTVSNSIAVDSAGNVYTTGTFGVTVDFDPNAGTFNMTAANQDVFISKLDTNGNLVWAVHPTGAASEWATGIALDAAGNPHITGYFNGTMDADPGTGTLSLTAAGMEDIFILKLSSSGNVIWAQRAGGTNRDFGGGVTVDAAGNVLSCGWFEQTVDFDPGAGTANITFAGAYDAYIWKLNSSGNYVWAKAFAGPIYDQNYDIATDSTGAVYLAGYIDGSGTDFDTGANTYLLSATGSSTDGYAAKLDASGNLVWAHSFGAAGTDYAYGIAVDNASNAFVVGTFAGTVDFDPGAAQSTLTSPGLANNHTFVLKLNGPAPVPTINQAPSQSDPTAFLPVTFNITFSEPVTGFDATDVVNTGTATGVVFALSGSGDTYTLTATSAGTSGTIAPIIPAGVCTSTLDGDNNDLSSSTDASVSYVVSQGAGPLGALGGGLDDEGRAITRDAGGNLYVSGYFRGTVDFDPGVGTANLTAANADAYIMKLSAAGSLVWVRQLVGTQDASAYNIALDSAGNVYSCGYYRGTVDFDPGSGTSSSTVAGQYDGWVLKLTNSGSFAWVSTIRGPGNETAVGLTVDDANIPYVTGRFTATADFDPGAGTFNLASAGDDAFLTRLNSSDGSLVWAKQFASDAAITAEGTSVTTDVAGDVYTIGSFNGAVDFDPAGVGVASRTALGAFDVFVVKLNAAGNFMWVQQLGSTGDDNGYDLVVDGSGNMYATGYFSGTVDFDPGAGTSPIVSAGGTDAFVWKLTSGGSLQWARRLGGTANDQGKSIDVIASGVYTAGFFNGTADFDPGAATADLVSAGAGDVFMSKLDSNGNYIRAERIGGTLQDGPGGIEAEPAGGAVLAGSFAGTADLEFGAGVTNRTSAGGLDAFVVRAPEPDTTSPAGPAIGIGGTGDDEGASIARDADGNLYVTGRFRSTVDFDPGAGTTSLSSAGADDIFILKLAADGSLVWARRIGGTGADYGDALALDETGNVYVTGSFQSTVDFDPGAGTVSFTSGGINDIYLLKLDNSGTFVWARHMPGSGSSQAGGDALAVSAAGVHITGNFLGTIDANPGPGTTTLTASNSDAFVLKLDVSGTLAWAYQAAGSGGDLGKAIAVDAGGNLLVTGLFTGSLPLGSTMLTHTGGGGQAYALKLDSNGNVMWALQMGQNGSNTVPEGIAIDSGGNIAITGRFDGTPDFDGGPGTNTLSSPGGTWDAFVVKLASSGSLQWARQYSSATGSDQGFSLAIDNDDNIYTTGFFQQTADFDPGIDTDTLIANGQDDIYIAKLSPSGVHLSAQRLSGTQNERGHGLTVDNNGNAYLTGYFEGTVDFDPTAGVLHQTSAGGKDAFVAKVWARESTPPNTVTVSPSTAGPTNANSISFTVNFDEPVQGFNAASDLLVAHSGTAHTGAAISGGPISYTVSLTGVSGNGSLTLAVSTASDVRDLYNNLLASSVTSTPMLIDNTNPAFTSIASNPPIAAEGDTVEITFESSEAISGDPFVTVNGHVADLSAKSGESFSYSYTVDMTDPLGQALIEVSGVDAAGNAGGASSNTALFIISPAPDVPVRAWPAALALGALGAGLLWGVRRRSAAARTMLALALAMVGASAHANDNCALAPTITENTPVIGTNALAGGSDITTCGTSDTKDMWYSYTPSTSKSVIISTCTSALSTTLAVFDACGGTELACNANGSVCSSQAQIDCLAVTGGQTYKIRVAGRSGASGAYTLLVTDCVPPPANDTCATAITVSENISVPGTTLSATGSTTTPCGGGADTKDIWYSYAPAANKDVTISLCGSAIDTTLQVFDGCSGASVGCNDDSPSCGVQSQIDCLSVQVGHVYKIRIAGKAGATGTTSLQITECAAAPANDNCATPVDVFDGIPVSSNNSSATGTDVTSCATGDDNDLWYRYTPSSNKQVDISLCGSGFDTTLAVFSACSGTQLACNDDSTCGAQSKICGFSVTGGQSYFIRVAGRNGAIGAFSLEVDDAGTLCGTAARLGFERFWPAQQQPWYFTGPTGVATAPTGTVYIVDTINNRVLHFSPDGRFIGQWGKPGTGPSMFNLPFGAAVSPDGQVYVADTNNNRVQIFTADGAFVDSFGGAGTANGQMQTPRAVAVASNGNVYVADTGNNRVQYFEPDGDYLGQWGAAGTGNSQFAGPYGIGVSVLGEVYVADTGNNRIQRFNATGGYLGQWGTLGTGNSQFQQLSALTVAPNGDVYATDSLLNKTKRFQADGTFISAWGQTGAAQGDLKLPQGIAITPNGEVYIGDTGNDRIQRFSATGAFLSEWESHGTGDGEFYNPVSVAIAPTGEILVADTNNNRVQRFNGDGQYLSKFSNSDVGPVTVGPSGDIYVLEVNNDRVRRFNSAGVSQGTFGSSGIGNGQFVQPVGIAAAPSGDVYVLDALNPRVQRFSSSGSFISAFGSVGEFTIPTAIAVSDSGEVYVADAGFDRVRRYTASGQFIGMWGSTGNDPGEFNTPGGIATDANGYVYISDTANGRIQKFSRDGDYINEVGGLGSLAGLFSFAGGLAVADDGRIYVADFGNHRVQVFRPDLRTSASKAIVVAAGGAFPGNDLWDATQLCANFAYRALATQGFTRETIQYLSSDAALDLDGNGQADDVDADSTLAALESALTVWAPAQVNGLPVEDVVLYLVDHGDNQTFRMSKDEILQGADLADWLDALDASLPGKLTVVIDACKSGSLLPALAAWGGAKSTDGRVVITSASATESAYFVNRGGVSFSNYFWTSIFNGDSVGVSYTTARQAMAQNFASQHPLMDAGGNAVPNETSDFTLANAVVLGNGVDQFNSAPTIGAVSPAQNINGTSTATLFADHVTDTDGIARVYGVIRTPDFVQDDAANPVAGLPTVELYRTTGNRFEGSYTQFNTPGTYNILIYAVDQIGNTCVPKLATVSVANPLKKKAVLIVGGAVGDSLASAYALNGQQAYQALKYQGYTDADITYMAPSATTGVDQAASVANIQAALAPAQNINTQDVAVYLVGPNEGSGIAINASETLSTTTLDTLLDTLQSSITGTIVVVLDASYSGGMLTSLTPVNPVLHKRVVIASARATQTAKFLQGGSISFSKYFWTRILNGASVYNAWSHAVQGIKFAAGGQSPQLDDTGDGFGGPLTDGALARNTYLGAGVLLAGDEPIIGNAVPPQTITGTSSATLWADPVTTTGTIDRVVAVITSPNAEEQTLDLTLTAPERYELNHNGFTQHGAYLISIFASDLEGNISLPWETSVTRSDAPDIYEVDNTFAQATFADGIPGEEIVAPHNFHVNGDQDWVTFYAEPGQTISMAALELGSACVPLLELYSTNGTTLLIDEDTTASISYNAWPTAGYYYLRITNQPPTAFGADTTYRVQVWEPTAPCAFSPALKLTVKDNAGALVTGASVQVKKSTVATYGAARTTGTTGTAKGMVTFTGLAEATYNIRVTKTGYTPNPLINNKVIVCTATNTHTMTLTRSAGTGKLDWLGPNTVAAAANTTAFPIDHEGTASVNWSVAEVVDYPWLSLSAASGTDAGSFNATFTTNTGGDLRRAWLRLSATYANGDPAPGNGDEFYVQQLGDTTPPVITLNGASLVLVYLNGAYTEPGYTAIDDLDGNVTAQVEVLGTVDTSTPGEYTLTYRVSDAAGNIGTASRQVVVQSCTSGICLTVEADGPTIVSKAQGETVTFTITATGDAPLTYRWFKGATELTGQNTASLTLSDLQFADAGDYYCVVNDANEEVDGPVFELTVVHGLPAAGWWGFVTTILLFAMVALRGIRRARLQ